MVYAKLMNKKGFMNIVVIGIIVTIIAAAGYFALVQKEEVSTMIPNLGIIENIQPTIIQPSINKTEELCKTTSFPIIKSISPPSGPVGTNVIIKGCNLVSFAWGLRFKNFNVRYPQSPSVLEYFSISAGDVISTANETVKFNIPKKICVAWPHYEKPHYEKGVVGGCITRQPPPGFYEVYYSNADNGQLSNKVQFTITE